MTAPGYADMIDVVNKTYTWLTVLFSDAERSKRVLESLQARDVQPNWNEPEFKLFDEHQK